MAYQNVGTPRFYIDYLLWLKSYGILEYASSGVTYVTGSPLEMISLNPSNQYKLFTAGASPDYSYTTYSQAPQILDSGGNNKNYIAVLGHNAASANASIHLANPTDSSGVGGDTLVNFTSGVPNYDGFTIAININFGDGDMRIHSLGGTANADHYIGCYSHGNYYDMPHSPDLSLTMTREYGGVKTIETKGGASLSNDFGSKPPAWGDLGAWELGGEYPLSIPLGASGRRIWDLSFSYLDDGDVFGLNHHYGQSVWGDFDENNYDENDIDGNEHYNFNILTDYNFYSQVIHKTNGGQLPFIFQPDKDDNTNFAICKFDQNSFSFRQTAPNLYSVKMKIREVW